MDSHFRNKPDAARIRREWEELARQAGYRPSGLAQLIGVSLRTLQRRFHAQYGMTVTEWLTSVRLRRAADRLQTGERVKEVAHGLGYKQLSHFSREFKRAFGVPPTSASQGPVRPLRPPPKLPEAAHILKSGPK